jgi:two-component system response regulator AtoC
MAEILRKNGRMKRILVVDDDEKVRFVLSTTLERMENGFKITAAGNGKDALTEFNHEPFDLVITDIRMPQMNGIELTEAIRQTKADTVVIWITAYECRYLQTERSKFEVFRCIDKPLRIEAIRQAVLEAF